MNLFSSGKNNILLLVTEFVYLTLAVKTLVIYAELKNNNCQDQKSFSVYFESGRCVCKCLTK